MTFILSIPIEIRLAVLFVAGCCLGGLDQSGHIPLGLAFAADQPVVAAPAEAPRRRWWDRIPVIGWFGLRREAAQHGGGFWVRPMLVELFCGVAFAFLYLWEVQWCRLVPENILVPQFFLPSRLSHEVILRDVILTTIRYQQYVANIVLLCFMLAAFWIDFDEMTIPDGITIPGTLLGLIIVSVWPYALLPQVNGSGQFGFPAVSSVWLTSPDYISRLPEEVTPRRDVEPWNVPAVTGRGALVAAIAAFWAWCLALTPGRWSTRHGYWRAVRVFIARAVREPATYGLLSLATASSAAIAVVWWHGGAALGGPGERAGGRRSRWRLRLDRSNTGFRRDGPRSAGLRRRDPAGHDWCVSRLAGGNCGFLLRARDRCSHCRRPIASAR